MLGTLLSQIPLSGVASELNPPYYDIRHTTHHKALMRFLLTRVDDSRFRVRTSRNIVLRYVTSPRYFALRYVALLCVTLPLRYVALRYMLHYVTLQICGQSPRPSSSGYRGAIKYEGNGLSMSAVGYLPLDVGLSIGKIWQSSISSTAIIQCRKIGIGVYQI